MEEYLKILLEQMRCQKAKPAVEAEIRDHIEEQITENLSFGMSREEAEKEAVRDMGDPVETGVSLDAVHRPQMAWDMVAIVGIISILSIGIQWLLGQQDPSFFSVSRHIAVVCVGFFCMLLVYRLDYSIFGKNAQMIEVLFLLLLVMGIKLRGIEMNGITNQIDLGIIAVSAEALLFLFVPIYAAILYRYRGSDWRGVLRCILWIFPPVVLMLSIPRLFNAGLLFLVLALLLSFAVYQGWFSIRRKRFLTGFWGVAVLFPVAYVVFGMLFQWIPDYQVARLSAVLSPQGNEFDYMRKQLLRHAAQSEWIGGNVWSPNESLEGFNSDYVLNTVAYRYGFLFTVLIVAVLLFLIWKVFQISKRQKNQLGKIIGYACGLAFLSQILFNLAVSFGLIERTSSLFPFISWGGTALIVNYVMIGLVLSIYRYKNIL